VVDPREPSAVGPGSEESSGLPEGGEAAGAETRWRLRLPARGAFGTGSHESTRLALELLEESEPGRGGGLRVLDLGTGTGILAFAALRLGARSVVGFDVDPVAVFHARENGRLNGFGRAAGGPRLFAGRVDCLASPPAARFDLAVANVIPEELLPELPAVVARLAPGGELILSGLLTERAGDVLSRLAPLGLVERARRSAGEWTALRLGGAAAAGSTGEEQADQTAAGTGPKSATTGPGVPNRVHRSGE